MTVFAGQVSVGTDDGAEANSTGAVSLADATDAFKIQSGFKAYGAWRIQNVTIPQGTTATAANLSFWTAASNTLNSTIYGNKVANPASIPTSSFGISGLASTTATAAWAPGSSAVGGFNNTADTSAIATELLGQGSFASGNAMLHVLQVNTGGAYTITQYDGTPADAAKLSITYTSASPPGAPSGLYISQAGATSVTFAWTQGSGTVTDNKIEYSTDNATWTVVDLGAAYTTYALSGPAFTGGVAYYWRVNAGNSGGDSAYSSSILWTFGALGPNGVSLLPAGFRVNAAGARAGF